MTRQQLLKVIESTAESMRMTNYIPDFIGNNAKNYLKIKVSEGYAVVYFDTKLVPTSMLSKESNILSNRQSKKFADDSWWERFCAEFASRLAKNLKGEFK